MTPTEIREAAEADLEVFIALVAPYLELGDEHRELIRWWTSAQRKKNVLVLLPRGHLKSRLVALKTAWEITRDPTETVLYVSATLPLAKKQLFLIKQILTSEKYREYWPEMVHQEEGRRELWTNEEIAVDHPLRAAEGIRDPTVKAAGLNTNITGFHATKAKFDDLVVPKNAYTEDGRRSVSDAASQIASILEPDARTDAVGTRYHPNDQYATFLAQSYELHDDEGNFLEEVRLWDVYQKVVEVGGAFLWPRKRRESDGKFFGFDHRILAEIKAKYDDRAQFYAQYYNNPNDPETARISRAKFQYYDRSKLVEENGRWYINDEPMAVFAGLDFAYSLNKRSDYTSLVVVGVTPRNHYYILDIARFQSNRIKDYFEAIRVAYEKWGFRKIRVETTAAQAVIARDLRENYIVPHNMQLSIDEHTPTKHDGTKRERIAATLEPKYDNLQVWHYKGGETPALEDELVMAKPPHDDIIDGLTSAIDVSSPPRSARARTVQKKSKVEYHPKFGGIRYR